MNRFKNPLGFAVLAFFTVAAQAHDGDHDHGESVLVESAVSYAGIEALNEFKNNFEAEGAALTDELVGFFSRIDGEHAEVDVYNVPARGLLQASRYDCHVHLHADEVEGAHCGEHGASDAYEYTAADGVVSLEQFRLAAEGSLSIFERRIGSLALVETTKMWRSAHRGEINVQVALGWTNARGEAQVNYFFCHEHRHGDHFEFDCHRMRATQVRDEP